MKKVLATILALVMALSLCSVSWAENEGVTTVDELTAAVANGGEIKLAADITLTSTLNLAKNVTIDGQGAYTIKAADNFTSGDSNNTACVLYVSATVTLKNVTVDGNEKCRVIFCNKGKLTIDGATITNGKAPDIVGGFIGGVYMTSSASFEMNSGSIVGNKNVEQYQSDKYLQYSSDLWIGANATGALTAIHGGTIGNVFVNSNAYSASNPGRFTMNGGTVTNLYVEHDKGYGAKFKYTDGTIEHLYLSKENGNGQSIEVTPVKGTDYSGGVSEEQMVTVTLNYNDNQATPAKALKVAKDSTITLPTPTRSGYTFAGWYNGTTKVAAEYKAENNITLTAKWTSTSSGGYYYHQPTTDTKADDTKGSPKTFDAGIALYVGMALTSAAGVAFVGKKRED